MVQKLATSVENQGAPSHFGLKLTKLAFAIKLTVGLDRGRMEIKWGVVTEQNIVRK